MSSAAAAGTTFGLLPTLAHAAGATPLNLIVVLAGGGWDVTYAFDPKPGLPNVDAPAGSITNYGNLPIFTNASRPNVAAFFQSYANIAAVVNGVYVRAIAHPACMRRMLTGTPAESSPDLAAIASTVRGSNVPVPYLVLGDTAFSGPLAAASGRIGSVNQITALLDAADAFPAPPGATWPQPGFVPDSGDETAIRAFVSARAQAERNLRGDTWNKARVDDFLASLDRGDQLKPYRPLMGPRAKTVSLAAQMAFAADALQNGVAWAAMIDSRLTWDTHTNNATQDTSFDSLFAGLKTLADDLASRPGKTQGKKMLDETLVVVLSEMSRTPKLNANAGKDHWPVTSMMLFGAGVAGGRAYGGTDDSLGTKTVDLATGQPSDSGTTLTTDHVVAGILSLLGVDSSPWLPNVEAFRGFVAT